MSLFDEIKKNVTDLTENVAKKSSTVIETQKMRMRKTSLEGDLRDYYVALGKLYEKQLSGECSTVAEAAEILEKISGARKEIMEIKDALMKAKGMVRCSACGQDVSREFDFCPKCGAKLVKPEPEEVIPPEDVTVEGDGESTADAGAKEAADAQDAPEEAPKAENEAAPEEAPNAEGEAAPEEAPNTEAESEGGDALDTEAAPTCGDAPDAENAPTAE